MTNTEHYETSISTPFIELYKLLKRENLTASGGEAKFVISEGMVQVNGKTETRKRNKIVPGYTVTFNGVTLEVTEGPPSA